MEPNRNETDLARLFEPHSIAHVGASAKPAAGRFNFTEYMLNMGFQGKVFPVNPKYEEVSELTCYPSLAAIPGPVDLAILALPAPRCVEVLRETPAEKVRFVVIHTSGFGEMEKGDLEEEILALSRAKGFRVIGPNCMGIYSQPGRIGFWRDHWEIIDRPGTIGFASQSGGHAINAIKGGMDSGVRFNKVVSLGNQLDISINEVVEFMGKDETVQAIGLYVEGIRDGRRFLELAGQITPRKPIVVWKGGTTEDGKQAVLSHTGAMAGNEDVFTAAMRQAGVLVVDNMHLMLRTLRLLQPPFSLPGGRLAIFSPGGGNSVNVSDLFSAQPTLSLPRFRQDTMEKLKSLLPEENVDVKNPVDPGAVGFLVMDKLIKAVGEEDRIDAMVVLLTADYLSNIKKEEDRLLALEAISSTISKLTRSIGKPVYILMRKERHNHEDIDRYYRMMVNKFIEKDIPWVDGSFKDAAEVFGQLAEYAQHVARWKHRAARDNRRRSAMTHRDAGDYSTKHGAGEKPSPEVAKVIQEAAEGGQLGCARVFKIASASGVSPSEAGKALDFLKIKLAKCQLGLFGYTPDKSIVKPAEKVSPELESAIRSRLENERLPCIGAWQIAEELTLTKLDVSCAAEALGIKIKPCQLGAF